MVKPKTGITGLPLGTKESGSRVDFDRNAFSFLVETKGPRFAWARAATCPCQGNNDQTQQPEPNCEFCKGKGRFHFGPEKFYVIPPDEAGDLDELQKILLEKDGAALIRGTMLGAMRSDEEFTRVGPWLFGNAYVTVRPENPIGFHDRLIALDAELTFDEILDAGDPNEPLALHFLAVGVNCIQAVHPTIKRWQEGVDFEVVNGLVVWTSDAPDEDTRISVHYRFHPQWTVWSQPQSFRIASTKAKLAGVPPPKTPLGTPEKLVIRAMVRLEHLEDP